jgi:hypothetical protein
MTLSIVPLKNLLSIRWSYQWLAKNVQPVVNLSKGNTGATPVKLFSNARCPDVKHLSNLERANVPAVGSFLRTISMAEKCIAAAPNVRKNRGSLSNNVASVAIGSTARPVAKKFQPIRY